MDVITYIKFNNQCRKLVHQDFDKCVKVLSEFIDTDELDNIYKIIYKKYAFLTSEFQFLYLLKFVNDEENIDGFKKYDLLRYEGMYHLLNQSEEIIKKFFDIVLREDQSLFEEIKWYMISYRAMYAVNILIDMYFSDEFINKYKNEESNISFDINIDDILNADILNNKELLKILKKYIDNFNNKGIKLISDGQAFNILSNISFYDLNEKYNDDIKYIIKNANDELRKIIFDKIIVSKNVKMLSFYLESSNDYNNDISRFTNESNSDITKVLTMLLIKCDINNIDNIFNYMYYLCVNEKRVDILIYLLKNFYDRVKDDLDYLIYNTLDKTNINELDKVLYSNIDVELISDYIEYINKRKEEIKLVETIKLILKKK